LNTDQVSTNTRQKKKLISYNIDILRFTQDRYCLPPVNPVLKKEKPESGDIGKNELSINYVKICPLKA
jgi:hypothetical protein